MPYYDCTASVNNIKCQLVIVSVSSVSADKRSLRSQRASDRQTFRVAAAAVATDTREQWPLTILKVPYIIGSLLLRSSVLQ